jgi:hypothetical protein
MALAIQAMSLQAQIWDYEYLGEDLAASPWTAPGNYTISGTAINIFGTGGDSLAVLDNTSIWTAGDTFTIEFQMSIQAQGDQAAQSLWAFTGATGAWQVMLRQDFVQLNGTTFNYSSSIGTTTNTYRLVVDGGVGSLSLNNTAILTNVAANTDFTGLDVLWVGDWGGAVNGDGRWEYLNINNTTAIPEPSVAALMTATLVAAFLRRRRKP